VCTNIRQAYKAKPRAHLGQSDHTSQLPIPSYTPTSGSKLPPHTVAAWHEYASHQLSDCFQRTDWEVFEHQDLENHTTAVLNYIKFCMGNVIRDKCIRIYPNLKSWINREVQILLKVRNTTVRSGYGGILQCCQSQPEERHPRGQGSIQAENRGPTKEQQHQAGMAAFPAHHLLAEELNHARFEATPAAATPQLPV